MSQKSSSSQSSKQHQHPQKDSLSLAIAKLSSSDQRKVYQGLVELRTKYVKLKDGPGRIRQYGGLERMLKVLQSTNHKNMDVALSIMGNCCMEDRTRTKMLHLEGIEPIISVLKTVSVESIRNRACRTLANLATDKHCCDAIHENEEAVPSIVSHLKSTEDEESQQTYTRALRMLADTPSHKAAVLECEGLKAAGDLLKPEKNCPTPVLSGVLKTIAHFLEENVECRRQLISSDSLSSILTLTRHDERSVRETCRSLLLAMLKQEQLRPPLGNAGCVDFLMETASNQTLHAKQKYSYLNALCLCCHEVVNRVRIREQGGLQLFLKLLADKQFHLIHYRLISALVCFLYDDQGFDILLQNNCIDVLLKHLRKCSKLGEYNPTLDFTLDDVKAAAEKSSLPSPVVEFDNSQDLFASDPEDEVDPTKNVENTTISDTSEVPLPARSPRPCLKLNIPKIQIEKETEDKEERKDEIKKSQSDNKEKCDKGEVAEDKPQLAVEPNPSHEETNTPPSSETRSQLDPLPGPSGVSVTSDMTSTVTSSMTSTIAECLLATDTTDSDSQGMSSDTDTKAPKYSMDSPTYKEISEWKFAPYHAGPTNIYESVRYYSNSGGSSPALRLSSPPRTGPYSPMSVSSYLSSDWSPEGSPSREVSQSSCWSPPSPAASAGLSPTPAALSEFNLAWDRRGEPVVREGRSPAWSSATNSQNTGYQSPDSLSRAPSPPVNISVPWWGDVTMPDNVIADQYSSEEEVETAENEDTSDALAHEGDTSNRVGDDNIIGEAEPVVSSSVGIVTGSSDSVTDDDDAISSPTGRRPVLTASESGQSSEVATFPKPEVTPCHSFTAGNQSPTLGPGSPIPGTSQGKCLGTSRSPGTSRRPHPAKRQRQPSTPDQQRKILKVVEREGSDKSLDIHSLISKLSSTRSSEAEDNHDNPAKHDEVNIHKDPLRTTQHNILVILSRVSYLTSPAPFLTSPHVIDTLLDYIQKSEKPLSRCSRILFRLSKNPHCLEAFLLKGTPVLVEIRRTAAGDENPVTAVAMQILSHLSLMCETRFGQGVIEHILLTGTEAQKQVCSLSLPLLCRSSSLKKKVFVKHAGLDFLLECLTVDNYLPLAVLSLNNLTTHLILTKPARGQPSRDVSDVTSDYDVTFVLDDGGKVRANRNAMIVCSEVFGAMLAGHYSESDQSEIRIVNANTSAFTKMAEFIHKNKYNVTDVLDSDVIDVLLEMSALADKYGINDLLIVVSNDLLDNHLCIDNASRIFLYSVVHNNEYLYKRCLFFMLAGEMTSAERVDQCFEPCLQGDSTEIRNTIKQYLISALSYC